MSSVPSHDLPRRHGSKSGVNDPVREFQQSRLPIPDFARKVGIYPVTVRVWVRAYGARPSRPPPVTRLSASATSIPPLQPPRNRHRHTRNSFSHTENAFRRPEIHFRSNETDFSTHKNRFWRSKNRFGRSKILFGVPKRLSRAPKSISGPSKCLFDAADTFPEVRE